MQIEAPKIRHYAAGTDRPTIALLPTDTIRVSREEIEAALRGVPHVSNAAEVVTDQIVVETTRMDQYPEGSFQFNAHAETIRRLLRQIGLYPIEHAG